MAMASNDFAWSDLQQALEQFYQHWHSLSQVLIILLATLLLTLVAHIALRKLRTPLEHTRHPWREAAIDALNAPAQGMLWMIGLSVCASVLTLSGSLPLLDELFPPARDVLSIGILAWFLMRLSRQTSARLYRQARNQQRDFDTTAADAVNKLVCALIIIIAVMVAMQTLGFSIASLLTFGGVAGVALGFAAQGLVANLLGGITIYTSRPFKVGESVIFPATDLMGEVQEIGWRATRILGWNGKPFYVPNAKFNSEIIINHSRIAYREISQTICIRLQDIDKIAVIVADVNTMLRNHNEMGDYLIFRFDSYSDHALRLYLYAYTRGDMTPYIEYMRVKEDLLLKIAAIITQHDAKLAVPVANLQMQALPAKAGPAAGQPSQPPVM